MNSLNSFIYECLRYFIEGYFKVDLEKPGQASTEEERKNISYTIEKFVKPSLVINHMYEMNRSYFDTRYSEYNNITNKNNAAILLIILFN